MKQKRHTAGNSSATSSSPFSSSPPQSSLSLSKTRTRRQHASSLSSRISNIEVSTDTTRSVKEANNSEASSSSSSLPADCSSLRISKSFIPLDPPPPPKRFFRESIRQFHRVLLENSFRGYLHSLAPKITTACTSSLRLTSASASASRNSSALHSTRAALVSSTTIMASTMGNNATTTTNADVNDTVTVVGIDSTTNENEGVGVTVKNNIRSKNGDNTNTKSTNNEMKSNVISSSQEPAAPAKLRNFSPYSPSESAPSFSFEEIYEAPASLGKQLEIRWFHSDLILELMKEQQKMQEEQVSKERQKRGDEEGNDGGGNGDGDENGSKLKEEEQKIIMRQHTMPFLRRSFSFIQISNLLSTYKNSNANVDSSSKMKILSTTKMKFKKRKYHPIHKLLQSSSYAPNNDKEKRKNCDNHEDGAGTNDENRNTSKTSTKKRKKSSSPAQLELSKSIFNYRIRQFNPKVSENSTDRTTRRNKKPKYSKYSTTVSSSISNDSLTSSKKSSETYKKVKLAMKHKIKASTYGKTFPPYRPYEKGVWKEPIINKNAFELYCERQMGRELTAKYLEHMSTKKAKEREDWNDDDLEDGHGRQEEILEKRRREEDLKIGHDDKMMTSTSLSQKSSKNGNERQERILFRKIKESWESLSKSGEKLYWIQEEAWDKERYLHEKYIYDTTREQGVDAVAECSNEIGKSYNGVAGFFINGLEGYNNDNDVADTINNRLNTGNVFYHFVYYKGDEIEVQREWRNDRRCPFCSFHAGSNKGMLIHCRTTHGDSLVYDGGIDEDNDFHVMIRSAHRNSTKMNTSVFNVPIQIQDKAPRKKDLMKNFVFFSPKFRGNEKFSTLIREDINILFIPKPAEMTKHLEPAIRRQKIRSIVQQRGDVHPQVKSQYIVADNQGPIRQYYHSRTNLPITRNEWENMEDSDDEDDDYWIRQLGESLMDDLWDVSAKEKIFMKLWNTFIKSYVVIADKTIPDKCREFILSYHDQLMRFDLRKHLLLHLFNLWDNGIVLSWEIVQMMNLFDEMKPTRNVQRRSLSEESSPVSEEKKLTE